MLQIQFETSIFWQFHNFTGNEYNFESKSFCKTQNFPFSNFKSLLFQYPIFEWSMYTIFVVKFTMKVMNNPVEMATFFPEYYLLSQNSRSGYQQVWQLWNSPNVKSMMENKNWVVHKLYSMYFRNNNGTFSFSPSIVLIFLYKFPRKKCRNVPLSE